MADERGDIPMPKRVIICAKCGKDNTSDNAYCEYCQWPLEANTYPDS